ncbi:ankyrin repeat domain-containing protein [Planctomycetota bacterium]
MNEIINNSLMGLNEVGGVFYDYTASVFIQSALLVILLFAIDLLLRKRVRAIFRYCVWLLVLVKLILPPMLSLPTGIGYWAGDHIPAASNMAFDADALEHAGQAGEMPQVRPVENIAGDDPANYRTGGSRTARTTLTPLTWQAVVFLLWLAGVLAFLAVLIQRIRFVKGLVAASCPASDELTGLLEQCRRQMAVRRVIKLRLSDTIPSPAVCGLLRPTVLMPTSLVDKLSPEGLKATLIHELAHIKRGDLWINSVQTFLQVVYFYNPFVWFANSMIRKVCEEAVDETVLVALGGKAKDYSNTLIDIGEMVFWKADLGLRLIGVAESKKALQWRIRHMLNRPIPKSAKLSVANITILVVIATVLLPMAKAEKSTEENKSVAVKNEERATKPLHKAVKDGDTEQVKSLISKGIDLNALNVSLNTPLCVAVDSGNMEIVKLLVEAGANVNAGSWSPLYTAVDNDRVAIAEYLIAHGADKHGDDYWTVLMEAFGESSIEMVKLLIAKGADIHFKSVELNGWTALHSAVDKGYKEIAELLIQKGVDVNAGPWTPLHVAARSRNRDIAELLIQNGADVNAKDHKGETPLYTAIRKKDLGVTQLLISKGANLKVKNNNGYTPLCEAPFAGKDILDLILAKGEYPDTIYLTACKGDLNGVKIWVDRGTDVNRKDEFGLSPLHWAVSVGSRDVTDYLIDVGANPNVEDDKQGATPLMLAHDALLAERLISKGADVRLKSQTGTTALHIACIFGIKDLAELLIRSGADINARDNYSATPLFRAAWGGYVGVIELLIEKGADVNLALDEGATPISMANQRSNAEVVVILRQHGAKETLHGAVASGDIEGVKRLIAQGADLNARNEKGQTPLHLSFISRYGKGTVLLISEGADVNAKDQAGETPLMMAVALGREYRAEVLITQGADVNAKANNGETALSLAKESGKTEMVELLRKYGAKE